MNGLRYLLWLATPLLLASCVISSPPVLGPNDSQEIAGLAGHWKSIKPDDPDLFVRSNPDGSYHNGKSPDKLDELFRVAGIESYGKFLVQRTMTLDDGQVIGILAAAAIYPGNLILHRDISPSLFAAAAKKTGLSYDGSSLIAPGQPQALVLATFNELWRTLDLADANLYVLQGGFVEPGGEKNTTATMERLLSKGENKRATEIAIYLSDRGELPAQLMLMRLAKAGVVDREVGIRHGLRAVYAGQNNLAGELARIYVTPPPELRATTDDLDMYWQWMSDDEAEKAFFWLSRSELEKGRDRPEDIQNLKLNLGIGMCEEDASPFSSAKLEECVVDTVKYWTVQAVTSRNVENAVANYFKTHFKK